MALVPGGPLANGMPLVDGRRGALSGARIWVESPNADVGVEWRRCRRSREYSVADEVGPTEQVPGGGAGVVVVEWPSEAETVEWLK